MTARKPLTALLLPCLLLASACTSTQLTYKAVSKDIPCDIDPDLTVFMDKKKVETGVATQSRQFMSAQASPSHYEFSDAELRDGARLAADVLTTFRRDVKGALSQRMARYGAGNSACYLAIEPEKFVADPHGPFTLEVKSSVMNLNAGKPVLVNRIRVIARPSASDSVADAFADALISELRKDRFFRGHAAAPASP